MTRPVLRPACAAAGCDRSCAGAGMPSNAELFERSTQAIPGGVNSSIRAFKSVGGTPYVVARAAGRTSATSRARAYIDLVQSYGAIILGHAHPAVTDGPAAAPRPRRHVVRRADAAAR